MKKTIILSAVLALVSISAAAQNATLFNVPSDPVSAALGGATAVLESTPYAVSNNPASMSLSEANTKFGASYSSWAPKTSKLGDLGIAGYGRMGKLAIGADFKFFSMDEYTRTSTDGTVLGTYKPSSFTGAIGVSYKIIKGFSLGVTGKFLSSNISESTKSSAFGVDVMAMCNFKILQVALGATNLATDLASAKAGIGVKLGDFSVMGDAQYIFRNSVMASIGAQYSLLDIVDFRAGWHFGNGNYAVPSYFSAGIGAGYKFIKVNGTYLFGSETLGNTFLVGLAFAF